MRAHVSRDGLFVAGVALAFFALLANPTPVAADGVEPAASAPSLGERAAYFRAYQRDIEAIAQLGLTSNREIKQAAQLLNSFDPRKLAEGFLAHHALLAANSRDFIRAVREESGGRHKSFLTKVALDDTYLSGLPESRDALSAVVSSASAEVGYMRELGARFEARAYELMNARMKANYAPQHAALQHVEFVPDEAALTKARYGARGPVNRILSTAAHVSMPQNAAPTRGAAIMQSLDDRDGVQCLKWAKLNLAQCLAAAAFPEEEAYCAGKHGLVEVSSCWSALAVGAGTASQLASTAAP